MKIDIKNGVGYDSNTKSEKRRFSIGKNEEFIIDLLRNKLYSDKIKTPIQEYLSNARDANVEAGNKEVPLQVTLPTEIDPQLTIRDFGPGVAPENMGLFTTYGDSTKRDSNDYIGGFGIGSKSAWAYTDSFQVITYIDGVKRSYVAHIGESNAGDLETLSETSTDQKNGTEIIIPVQIKDVPAFRNAVLYTTFFWDVKPNLLGILEEEIPSAYKDHEKVFEYQHGFLFKTEEDFIRLSSRSFYGNNLIIVCIDGIPYFFIPDDEMKEEMKMFRKMLVLTFGNGELDIAASREAIETTPENQRKILTKIKKVSKKAMSQIQKEHEECKSLQEYCALKQKFNKYYNEKGKQVQDVRGVYTEQYLSELFLKKVEVDEVLFEVDEYGARNDHYFSLFEFKRWAKKKRHGKKIVSEVIVDMRGPENKIEIIPKRITLKNGANGHTSLYLFLDQEEKPRNLSRKIKKILEGGHDGKYIQEVFLITPKKGTETFKFKEDLNYVNSSEIELPKPVKRVKDTRLTFFKVTSKSYHSGYKLDSLRYDEDDLIEDLEDKEQDLVYYKISHSSVNHGDLKIDHLVGLEKYFSKRGKKLIGISPTNLKKWPKSIPLEELNLEDLKNAELNKEEKVADVFDSSMAGFLDSFFVNAMKESEIAKIKDKRIKLAIRLKRNYGSSSDGLGYALELFTKELNYLEKRKEKYQEFFDKLKEEYSVLNHIDTYYRRGMSSYSEEEKIEKSRQSLANLFILVLNSAFQESKK